VKTKGKRKPHPGQAEAAHSERDDNNAAAGCHHGVAAVGLPSDLQAEYKGLCRVVGGVEETVPERSGNRTKHRSAM